MASKFVCICNTNNDSLTTASVIAPNVSGNPHTRGADAFDAIRNIGQFMEAQVGGRGINTVIYTGAISASGLITFTGRPTADETLTICNTTLTAKDSGANGTTQFNTDASLIAVTAA